MQIKNYKMLFGELSQVLVDNMTETQREANRDFAPTVASIMHIVYDICANERGQGSFSRMKYSMTEHVERNRQHMFNTATMTVKNNLDSMCRSLQGIMEARANEILVQMKADYMRVLGGVEVHHGPVLSREERHMRSETIKKLAAVNAQFEPIVQGEITSAYDSVQVETTGPAADSDADSIAFEPRTSTTSASIAGPLSENSSGECALPAPLRHVAHLRNLYLQTTQSIKLYKSLESLRTLPSTPPPRIVALSSPTEACILSSGSSEVEGRSRCCSTLVQHVTSSQMDVELL